MRKKIPFGTGTFHVHEFQFHCRIVQQKKISSQSQMLAVAPQPLTVSNVQ